MGVNLNAGKPTEEGSKTIWTATDVQAAAQTDTVLQAAPGAGLSLYITDIIISNGSTAGTVEIVENTASSTTILETMNFAVNGGAVINLQTPIKVTENDNLGYTSVTVTDHSITVCGYTAP